MNWYHIADDQGLDDLYENIRPQIVRLVITVFAGIFLIYNYGLNLSLIWSATAFLSQFFTYTVGVSIRTHLKEVCLYRVATIFAMLFQTVVWTTLAIIFWDRTNLAFCIASFSVLAGQVLNAIVHASRSRAATFVCGFLPGLTVIGLTTFASGLQGADQLLVFATTVSVMYYALVSAESSFVAQSGLDEQRRFSKGIIDALDFRIGIIDQQGEFIHLNRVWRERKEQYEQLTNSIVGNNLSDHCAQLSGRKGPLIVRQLLAMAQGQLNSFSTDYRSNLYGPTRWFNLRAFPLKDAGNAKVLIVQVNVTKLKSSELELKLTNRELRRSRLEADLANRAKSRFLATMGHEIRTPLNGIVAIADVLSRADLDEEQHELVDTIIASADTLSGLLVDMLDLARIEAGRVNLDPAPFNLGEALRSVSALSNIITSEKGVDLNIVLDPSVEVWVNGDLTRFKQVITNLISNAVKFTDEGSVTVIANRDQDGQVMVSIADTGIGFDPRHLERLFNPFEQANETISRRFGGTGLGLAIVKQLVQLMGGVINCESELGRGSTFKITLPMALAQEPQVRAETNLESIIEGAPLVILVVDDHPVNRKVVGLILNQLNIELVMVENGEQAVQAFRNQPFDLVLMDMQMPVMDGLDATRAIRVIEQESGQGRTPVIMFSANALTEHIEQSLDCGADMHLAKPITAQGLLGALSHVFQKEREAPVAA